MSKADRETIKDGELYKKNAPVIKQIDLDLNLKNSYR